MKVAMDINVFLIYNLTKNQNNHDFWLTQTLPA